MTQEQQCVLGICGGVGPAAGVLLHQIILEHTESRGCDQGHLDVCHFSRSEDMTDRTEYLQHHATQQRAAEADTDTVGNTDSSSTSSSATVPRRMRVENPARGMARTLAMMQAAVASGDSDSGSATRLVTGVPCNTFHAKPIWDEFVRLTAVSPRQLQHVHMLEETVRFIAQSAPACTRIGLMATTGTRDARVYHDLLEPRGYRVIEICASQQAELHESIYNSTWGIKSTAPAVTPRCVANFHRYARQLAASGAEVIVMGCTEIPFAFAGCRAVAGALLIDPLVALARAMIREADPRRLKPLTLDGGSCVAPLDKLSQPRTPTKYCATTAVASTSCWSPR